MAMALDYAPGARLFVSLQRRTGEAPFDATSYSLLGPFARQVNSAKQTEARLRTSAYNNMALAAGLDAFVAAMFVVDANAWVRHQNRAADTLLRACKRVEFHSGRLQLTSSGADARLLQAVRAAAQPSGQTATFTMTTTGGASLQVLATPLHPAHDFVASWQEPLVLVIVADTHQMATNAAQRMRWLYGLTGAESQLVAELADGKTLHEIAELRAVALATLRTQLIAAFGKTGVRRQVDLVRLVAALASVADDRD